MGMFQGLINYLLWLPVKWLLQLLNSVNDVVKYLASDLFESILFGNKVSDWNQVLIPATYYRILIVAAVCWVVFLVATFICHLKRDIIEHEETPLGKKILESLKYSTFSAILLIFIPLFVWMLVKMTSIMTQGIMIAFGSKNISIADLLYNMGNPNWNGNVIEMNGSYPAPSDLADWNMIVELVGLCIVFICLLLVMINIVTNTFATFFYFILTGFYALTAVFDQGARMKDYAKTIIANNFIICSSMVIFSVYSSLIQISFNSMSSLGMDGATKMLLQLALACGGGLFVVNGDQYVSRLVGENISGVSTAMSGLGAIKAGMMMAAGLGVAAVKMGKKGLMGRKNVGKGAQNAAKSMFGGGSDAGNSGGEEIVSQQNDLTNLPRMQQAKENFIKGRQQAMERYQKGGILGFAGMGIAGAVHGGKFVKNALGSFVGSKTSRMIHREQLAQQKNTVKKGLVAASIGALGKVGSTLGGVTKMTGLNKTVNKTLNERGNVFNEDKMKNYNDKLIERNAKYENKLNKKIEKYQKFSDSDLFDLNSYVKKEKLINKKDKKIKKFTDEQTTLKNKFDTSIEKWAKYGDGSKEDKSKK